MQKRVLGKGLRALIPEANAEEKGSFMTTLRVEEIRRGKVQPRSRFDESSIQELAQSIKSKGLIQPLLVRRLGDGYELIAGERRLKAIQSLGIHEVPAIIKDVSRDDEVLQVSLIENLQRENLNPMEEATAYSQLIEKHGLTQEDVAKTIGKDRSSIANALRLLKLPDRIREALTDGLITAGHAKALLGIDEPQAQLDFLDLILQKNLSVRAAEKLAKTGASGRVLRRKRNVARDPHLVHAEEELQRSLGTRVRLFHGRKRGKILIEYYSNEDLARILSRLGITI